MKQGIVKRLVVVGIGISLCVGIFLSCTILISKKGIVDGYVINIAGRERMLSQKISKEVFVLNSQDKADFSELDRSLEEFQAGLDSLKYGNKEHGSAPSSDEDITRQLENIGYLWADFRQNVLIFKLSVSALNSNKAFLDEHNKQMLTLSDNIVKSMVAHGLSGQDVDDSGRQRMLTQRMAYHLTRYANKWDAQSYRDFYDSYNLYNETILRFYISAKFKKYPKLFGEIEKTYRFWLEYSPHAAAILANQQTVVDALNEIITQNQKLLSEIEKVVDMYEKESIRTRTYLLNFQLISALILIFLAVYAVTVIKQIRVAFNQIIQKSKTLALSPKSALSKEEISEMMAMEGENELSEISANISQFVKNMGLYNSNKALELSNNITEEITKITNDVAQSLKALNIGDEEKQKILSEISLSEDIAIQTSEELIATSKLLNRLKKSLDVIAKYYDIAQVNGDEEP
ncbi:MAG: type IV pili methyl-accepting chemotaxis transducer N-terminal domain-containing protein [Campylobacteraceae bacterium]|jgi:nitrate/nitrite-specific signal transduction histidine kinase|nr:type IV pili methyl-accepting chemotaxis transducer N-terminal domain-containing protein [Campylobacteraceae bacterium]